MENGTYELLLQSTLLLSVLDYLVVDRKPFTLPHVFSSFNCPRRQFQLLGKVYIFFFLVGCHWLDYRVAVDYLEEA